MFGSAKGRQGERRQKKALRSSFPLTVSRPPSLPPSPSPILILPLSRICYLHFKQDGMGDSAAFPSFPQPASHILPSFLPLTYHSSLTSLLRHSLRQSVRQRVHVCLGWIVHENETASPTRSARSSLRRRTRTVPETKGEERGGPSSLNNDAAAKTVTERGRARSGALQKDRILFIGLRRSGADGAVRPLRCSMTMMMAYFWWSARGHHFFSKNSACHYSVRQRRLSYLSVKQICE